MHTSDGESVASFTLAVEHDYINRDDTYRPADNIYCLAYEDLAQFTLENYRKGSLAIVVGRFQICDWEDRDGCNRRSFEVVAKHLYLDENQRRRRIGF